MTNKICYFEIGSRDRAASAEFYSKVFSWRLDAGAGSTRIDTGDAINGHITTGNDSRNYTIFYIMVDDVASALAKAVSAGGRSLVGPVSLPDGSAFGWFADPEGNTVGVYAEK
jgi:hypothetical protein